MEEIGEILQNTGKEALVKVTRHSMCSKCTNKCELAIADDHESDEMEVKVSNPVGAKKGQLVKIEMGEQPLVIASLIVYLIPLLSLIIGYFAGQYFMQIIGSNPTEGAGIIGALLFLGLSFILVNLLDKTFSKNNKYRPVIKEILN